MDIANCINRALEYNSFVSLPGLGSLVKEYKPARENQKKKQIDPGFFTITFNPERNFEDNVLVNHLQKYHDYSELEAHLELKKWCDRTLEDLKSGQNVALNGIGTLQWENGKITLTPPENDFNALGWGMEQGVPLPQRGSNSKRRKRKWAWLIATTSLVVVLIAMVGYIFNQYPELWGRIQGLWSHTEGEYAQERLNVEMGNPSQSAATPESNANENNESRQENLSDSTPRDFQEHAQTIDSQTSQQLALQYTPPQSPSGYRYHIIAGSFTSNENALKMVNRLRNEGYNAEVIIHNSIFRVSIGWYSNIQRAQLEVEKLQMGGERKELWIFKQRVQ